jgi:hypothetical protein
MGAPLAKALPTVNGAQGPGPLGADVVDVARTPLAEREAVLSMTQATAAPGSRASARSRAPRTVDAMIKRLGRFIAIPWLVTS